MTLQRSNNGSRAALEAAERCPEPLSGYRQGQPWVAVPSPQCGHRPLFLTCRHFEPPASQTATGLNPLPWLRGCWSGPNEGKERRAGRRRKEGEAPLIAEHVLQHPQESGCYWCHQSQALHKQLDYWTLEAKFSRYQQQAASGLAH